MFHGTFVGALLAKTAHVQMASITLKAWSGKDGSGQMECGTIET